MHGDFCIAAGHWGSAPVWARARNVLKHRSRQGFTIWVGFGASPWHFGNTWAQIQSLYAARQWSQSHGGRVAQPPTSVLSLVR